MSLTEPTDAEGHLLEASPADPASTDAELAEAEARIVLAEFLPDDQVVRKRVFSSLLRGLTRGTS